MSKILTFLDEVPLFYELPNKEREYLADMLRIVEISPGTMLMHEGERGERFYVVVEGQIEIIKAFGTPEERILAVRGAGEFIGEMSLFIEDGLRTASACAVSQSYLLELARADFDHLLERRPQLAFEIIRVLSLRLRTSNNETIRDLRAKNVQLRQAYDELQSAQEQLVEMEKLERELQVAHDIQMSILPDELPQVKGYDLGALMVPARMVGGDFYDLIPLAPGKLGVVVGDVTDKGVPAALFMAQTHALLRSQADPRISPRETLLRVNHHLLRITRDNYFVTVLYGVLDQDTGELEYARAGHELPLLFTPINGVTQSPMGVGLPLGFQDNPTLDEHSLVIPQGGTLLLYTDGLTDGLGAANDELGVEKLKYKLNKIAGKGKGAQGICDVLFQTLNSSQNGTAQFDDVTMVAIKPSS